jgi:hypothetical protein
MAVRVGKKMVKGQSEKGLTVVECWLLEGKETNEKEANHPAHPMDRTANWCRKGGWFTLAPTSPP